jgi:hypothetical protein
MVGFLIWNILIPLNRRAGNIKVLIYQEGKKVQLIQEGEVIKIQPNVKH